MGCNKSTTRLVGGNGAYTKRNEKNDEAQDVLDRIDWLMANRKDARNALVAGYHHTEVGFRWKLRPKAYPTEHKSRILCGSGGTGRPQYRGFSAS